MATRRATRRLPRVGGGRLPVRLLAVLVVTMTVAGTTWFSGASFTSRTESRVSIGAAADYRPPTVAVTSPGALVTGTVTVSATASDTASGVVRVTIEAATATGAWTVLCADTTAPWSCSWDTTKVADGDVRLRATAVDAAGFSTTSAVVTTRVANAAAVDLATVPGVVRGPVPLSATVTGAAGRTVSTTFSYVDEAGRVTAITGCTGLAGTTPSCTWQTGGLADVYDVRVVSTLGTGTTTVVSDVQTDVTVDNVAPTLTFAPGTPLRGSVTLSATALDEDSGVASVVFTYQRTGLLGTGPVVTVCTVTTDPFRCTLDTTTLADGTYTFTAVATDEAGNTTTVTATNRTVDNSVASVVVTAPSAGEALRGTVTVSAAASPGSLGTATDVRLQYRLAGTTGWTDICVDATAPYSCSWATPAGTANYELQAVFRYTTALAVARTVTSAAVPVTVDNNPLRALDVQAANGGLLGKADGGDALTLTFSTLVDLTSVRSGWDGSATTTSLSLHDQKVGGSPVAGLDWANLGTLGKVAFAQNYLKKGKSVPLTATMTATTATVGGAQVTVVRLVLDPVTHGGLRSATAAGTLRWTPVATLRSTTGTASSTTPASESGAADADL